MKAFLVDFNRVITDSQNQLTDALQLGYQELTPTTRDLEDGDLILVDMPGELQAEARVTQRDDERGRYWYAELVGQVHYYEEEGAPIQQAS